jgi:two-component system, NtrC family, sensor kinase
MVPKTLKFRVGLYVSLALTVVLALFMFLVVKHEREQLLDEAIGRVAQLSEVITRSTRFAMLQNQPYYVHRIIEDVGNHKSIDKVRIFSKEGVIIDSTYPPEIGQKVDRNAEACVRCHLGEQPLEQLPSSERSRIFTAPDGRRLLGTMEVIRNEPSCSNAGCHVHSPNQSVLGVLDIVYKLDDIDRTMRTSAYTIAALSLGFIVLAALAVTLFVRRLIYVPLTDLELGAKRIAGGNLEETIPVRSEDEFGQLASSFNAMTVALRNSQAELREWGYTLEKKVEERTQQLKVAEAEAVQSEKLASVGLLAAGIAHELNNPLTGVLTFSSLIRQNMPAGSADAEDMDLVIRETRRCADIIRRLLDFAREKAPEKKYTDLNQVIEETARLVQRPANLSDIVLTLELDPNLPPVWVDGHLIKQVVMNMLVNAQHAIEGGGSITLKTRRFPTPLSPEPGAPAVPMIEISVIDTGCGIPEKNLKRIFDPFFTSKEVGKGTGLGLSVSHGIVKAHGGAIKVESTVGKGSTFRVYLPLEAPGVRKATEGSAA